MDDDLNTSKALAVLFELTNKANKDEAGAFTILFKLASALGFTFEKQTLSEEELAEVIASLNADMGTNYSDMEDVIAARKTAREEKNWAVADAIRIGLDKQGILLKDGKEGTTWELK